MKDYTKHFLILLAPAVLAILISMNYGQLSWDWDFHISGEWGIGKSGNYPPIAPVLSKFFYDLNLLPVFAVAIFVLIPFYLIITITKNVIPGFIYVYASGLPFVMTWGGFVAQGLVHIYMLICVANIWSVPLMLILAMLTHREGIGAVIVASIVGLIYKRVRQ